MLSLKILPPWMQQLWEQMLFSWHHLSVKCTVWAQVPGLITLCVSPLLFIGLSYAKTSINVG